MAKFNPIRDLMPADPFNVPAGQSSKEVADKIQASWDAIK